MGWEQKTIMVVHDQPPEINLRQLVMILWELLLFGWFFSVISLWALALPCIKIKKHCSRN